MTDATPEQIKQFHIDNAHAIEVLKTHNNNLKINPNEDEDWRLKVNIRGFDCDPISLDEEIA